VPDLIYIAGFVFALMVTGIALTAVEFKQMKEEEIDAQGLAGAQRAWGRHRRSAGEQRAYRIAESGSVVLPRPGFTKKGTSLSHLASRSCSTMPMPHPKHQSSNIATQRVQPAEASRIFTGKHATVKPLAGNASRLWSFSICQ